MNESEILYRRINDITSFLNDKSGDYLFLGSVRAPVERAYSNDNIQALRTINNELDRWVASLSSGDQNELRNLLHNRGAEKADPFREVEKIVHKGSIANVDEYRTLIDATSDIDLPKNLIGRINNLLKSYQGSFDEY